MLASIRAGALAALSAIVLSFTFSPTFAADKPFQRDDLSDSAIRLEAQMKTEAGTVTKPLATLRREADASNQRNELVATAALYAQILTITPNDSGLWLRYARVLNQTYLPDSTQRAALRDRAKTAAYIAYQRSQNAGEEADSLIALSGYFSDAKQWRPALDTLRLSLEKREVADIRARYESMRIDYGFRMLDYSVDSDSASPRACFQFSEALPAKRTDFSLFVAVAGMDKPALSADEKQLCVEGLKHGERYAITLRAGLPSLVKESLSKSAELSIYVRDRKPFVRFAGKAYVLPRTGQQGIPIVSVNTKAVAVEVYRIGDRNLIETVLGSDFQTQLERYEVNQLAESKGAKIWSGDLAVDSTLNADVTTAFPVDQAIGNLQPGVYVLVAGPKSNSDRYESLATQWFIVSDLGLTAYSGADGVHVFVHSLADTSSKAQVEVRLMARSNEVLATKRTDAAGHAHFEPGLTRGEGGLSPALLIASVVQGEADYAFLGLKSPAFDLSDRGVSGREVPTGLDAFVYTERGVYRSGEDVHVTALLRDGLGVAAVGVPLTLVIERPDGMEYRRAVVADGGVGGRTLNIPINAVAPTGTWRVAAFTDPKRPAVGETTFLVEDYVPDRMEFELNSPSGKISKTAPAEISLEGRYLYGAPAADLSLEGEVVISAAKERPGLVGYQFGTSDESVENTQQALSDLPNTDENGKATFTVELDKVPSTLRLLQATVTVRMAESGGRAVERKMTLPVTPSGNMIGVKPLFSGRSLGEGEQAGFDVVLVAPDGSRIARDNMRYELVKIESRYQWYRHDSSWNYEPIKQTSRVADGRLDLKADQPARLSLPVTYGRYRLEIASEDPNGPTTTIGFDAGFYAEATADTPDLLEIALDKPEYRPGDSMTVAVTARTAGQVSLNVIGNRLITTQTADVKPGLNQVKLNVGTDWGNGAYVVATLRRPLDAKAQRMPGRAIGVQWFAIDRKARTLTVDLKPPTLIRPETTLKIPVKIDGLTAGEDARIVIAAVDVGILNLTGYKPPAPDNHYLGQRRLTAEIRDFYGQLIDGMQGSRGQIRSGGDAAAGLQGSPPAQKPVSLYSGIVTVGPDGTAEISFDVPAFAGTLRVMAVAWSKDKVGRANTDVTVRDPVVLTATLPRFLRNGDRSALRLDVDNVDGAAGDYRLTVKTDGPIAAGEGATQTVKLAAKQRVSSSISLTAPYAGAGQVNVELTGPNGFRIARGYALNVNPATQTLTRRTVKPIAKGESVTLSADLFADLVPGTGAVGLSVGLSTALDAATILRALDRYPFGCSEQVVSRALPLLYVNELATASQLAMDGAIDQRIRDAIERVLARQSSSGGFGLWDVGSGDPWLDAYVTDFLTRARERGFQVPDTAFKLALDRLRNFVSNAQDVSKGGSADLAYALYVLARNGQAPIGDLRYLADVKLADIETPIAKAQIAAALGMLGDKTRADRVYAAALQSIPQQPLLMSSRADYGSALRDSAALVTLASEGSAPRQTVFGALQRVEAARGLSSYTSTQENSWLVLAARAIAKDADKVSLMVGGQARQGALFRTVPAGELQSAPLTVTNTGESPLQAVLSVTGAPITPEPAAERGFKIERLTYALDGEPVDIKSVKQNQRVVIVLKITEGKPDYGRIMVADYLPAGFEIDNPKLVSSGETGTLSWITDAGTPVNSEFRDDRFTAAFNRSSSDRPVFTVAYVVRAVAPGQYVMPQAYVEDMYRPDRFGRTGTGTLEVTSAK
ncbi:MAG: alpha-2-macroglobulin [Xanthobacteraceae bacterium]|nr:alpha-2-macroglobulin [Xanthobacteraceae bacterium]